MEIASLRETSNFSNTNKAVSPYNLGQVLSGFATQTYVVDKISKAKIDPSQVDLSAYAKKTDVPTKTSELTNDSNFVETSDGKIPSDYLPAYVDDVLEFDSSSAFPYPGESGKIYVSLDTNLTYRWSGTEYVEISKSLALGETSSTAYRGDRGKKAYSHSQTKGNPHGLALTDLGITVTADEINLLDGIDTNILTLLAGKLNLTGGTLTGSLLLSRTPVDKMEAATKDYVDTCINGISVTVTQNVTKLSELTTTVEGLTSTVETQAETLTTVTNGITGLNQTTSDHTTYISNLTQKTGEIETTVGKTTETLTTLEAAINLLNASLAKYYVVIPVNKTNTPTESKTNITYYQVLFEGNEVTPEVVTITESYTGLSCINTEGAIEISYSDDTPIEETECEYTVAFKYTSESVEYEDTKKITVITVPQGEDGEPGSPGSPGEPGAQGEPGKDAAIISATEPEDTTKLWFNTSNNMIYIYQNDEWVITNDNSDQLSNLQGAVDQLPTTINKEIDSFVDNTLKKEYYTREETASQITQGYKNLNIDFTNRLETVEGLSGTADKILKDFSGYIHTGTEEGVTYLELGNVSSDYKLRLENDKAMIQYKGKTVSLWEQNLFQVESVISQMLRLSKFAFIVNDQGTDDESISFRKL